MSEDPQDAFKVTDRRLFNADGTPREAQAEPEPEPVLLTTSDQLAESAQAESAQAEPSPAPSSLIADDVDRERTEDDEPGGELTEFMGVLMEFATPAFIHLGLAEHPATGRPEVNLPAAQQAIEMLRVLREKTTGNLTREEDDFFEGLLADLRMRFVSLKKQQ